MGAYLEDFEIQGTRLICLWVAEGFVKSNGERSLEEEAEDWLKSLVERNLILVRKYNKYGKPKSYNMHDMLRDLCIRKSNEDKFLHVTNGPKLTFSNPRRMSFYTSNGMEDVNDSIECMSLIRSVKCIGFKMDELPSGDFSMSRLLRVLDFMDVLFNEFPTEIFEFVNLRFLGVKCRSSIPKGISRLWKLQTLICYCEIDVPSELWKLSELRHLEVYGLELLKDEEMNYSVLEKLQMISLGAVTKEASTWDGFFKSIPNIKKLGIDDGNCSASTAIDLSHLHKLEILKCINMKTIPYPDGLDCRCKVIFPCYIRKLVLWGCIVDSGVLRTLCALHELNVLKITFCKFKSEDETCDEEWEVADGDVFRSLQFLYLEFLSLVRWIADETNFPILRHLGLYSCKYIKEIPNSIGDIPTLQLLELKNCTDSAAASVKRIEEEQSEYCNYDLKLHIA